MSASLVGSEMCIRDRLHPRVGGGGVGRCLLLRGLHGICGRTACRRAPVSYTHLTLPTICSV
eukprot:1537403-Alexandrium_andersonii.AAC.1